MVICQKVIRALGSAKGETAGDSADVSCPEITAAVTCTSEQVGPLPLSSGATQQASTLFKRTPEFPALHPADITRQVSFCVHAGKLRIYDLTEINGPLGVFWTACLSYTTRTFGSATCLNLNLKTCPLTDHHAVQLTCKAFGRYPEANNMCSIQQPSNPGRGNRWTRVRTSQGRAVQEFCRARTISSQPRRGSKATFV